MCGRYSKMKWITQEPKSNYAGLLSSYPIVDGDFFQCYLWDSAYIYTITN